MKQSVSASVWLMEGLKKKRGGGIKDRVSTGAIQGFRERLRAAAETQSYSNIHIYNPLIYFSWGPSQQGRCPSMNFPLCSVCSSYQHLIGAFITYWTHTQENSLEPFLPRVVDLTSSRLSCVSTLVLIIFKCQLVASPLFPHTFLLIIC